MPRQSMSQLFVDTRENENMGTCRVFLSMEDCSIYVRQCNIRTMNRLSDGTDHEDYYERARDRCYAVVRVRYTESSDDERSSTGVDGVCMRVTFVRWICYAEYRNMSPQTAWADQQGMWSNARAWTSIVDLERDDRYDVRLV